MKECIDASSVESSTSQSEDTSFDAETVWRQTSVLSVELWRVSHDNESRRDVTMSPFCRVVLPPRGQLRQHNFQSHSCSIIIIKDNIRRLIHLIIPYYYRHVFTFMPVSCQAATRSVCARWRVCQRGRFAATHKAALAVLISDAAKVISNKLSVEMCSCLRTWWRNRTAVFTYTDTFSSSIATCVPSMRLFYRCCCVHDTALWKKTRAFGEFVWASEWNGY